VATFIARVAQEVNIAADAFGRIAVMAHAINLTGGLDIETFGIDG
jgi:hypothetical protein